MKESHANLDKNTPHTIGQGGITRFGERLSTLIKGESFKSFAKRCDMSDKAIRDYVAGKTYPSLDRIAHIANVAGCSFEWLATGYDMDRNNPSIPINTRRDDNDASDKQQKVWLEIFERMTPEERELVLDNVFRRGINVLLGKTHSIANNSSDNSFDDLSAEDMLIARMYASLTPEDKKSFLESVNKDERSNTNRNMSDKTKAS